MSSSSSSPPVSSVRVALLVVDLAVACRALYKLLEIRWRNKYITPLLQEAESKGPQKEIRVWVDGVFDMMHFGHANMLRQARALGHYLVVGVNSDDSVRKEKGTSPVMSEEERYTAVAACKWVDEVVKGSPYVMDTDYLDFITREYKIDLIVHGDDPCFDAQGRDVYGHVKEQGRFRTVKRTEGVSSTELVGRMLLMTKDHLHHGLGKLSPDVKKDRREDPQEATINSFGTHNRKTRVSQLVTTTRRISQFSEGQAPKTTDKVIYVDGSWDLFHSGHMELLREAKALGDFVLVGICDDETVNQHRGGNWPIMNLHERTLCVLSCRYVDEVIIGAPWCITKDLIKTMNISVVVHGTIGETKNDDTYLVAKEMGIYKQIPSPSTLTTDEIVLRILTQRENFEQRYSVKAKKEEAYLESKEYIQEI